MKNSDHLHPFKNRQYAKTDQLSAQAAGRKTGKKARRLRSLGIGLGVCLGSSLILSGCNFSTPEGSPIKIAVYFKDEETAVSSASLKVSVETDRDVEATIVDQRSHAARTHIPGVPDEVQESWYADEETDSANIEEAASENTSDPQTQKTGNSSTQADANTASKDPDINAADPGAAETQSAETATPNTKSTDPSMTTEKNGTTGETQKDPAQSDPNSDLQSQSDSSDPAANPDGTSPDDADSMADADASEAYTEDTTSHATKSQAEINAANLAVAKNGQLREGDFPEYFNGLSAQEILLLSDVLPVTGDDDGWQNLNLPCAICKKASSYKKGSSIIVNKGEGLYNLKTVKKMCNTAGLPFELYSSKIGIRQRNVNGTDLSGVQAAVADNYMSGEKIGACSIDYATSNLYKAVSTTTVPSNGTVVVSAKKNGDEIIIYFDTYTIPNLSKEKTITGLYKAIFLENGEGQYIFAGKEKVC